MRPFTGLISGGLMGSDPFDATSWSGSSANFFRALQERQLLGPAFGAEIPDWQFWLQALPEFSTDREIWRRRTYRKPAYRKALSGAALARAAGLDRSAPLIQLGAYVNMKPGWNGPVYTYQDGNAAEYFASPFAPAAIRQDVRRNEKSLDWERRVAEDASLVLTTSNYLASSFVENYDLPADKVVSIGCGINAPLPASVPVRNFEQAKLLFIGKEFARKGGPDLLAAFAIVRKNIPTAELHIIGPEAPANLPPGVRFHGFLRQSVPEEKAIFEELFASCTLFVLPTHYEPLGLAPLEAMGWGMPALVTGKWALAENVVAGEHGGHCAPGDPAGLAEKLIDLLEAPEALANMGQKARAHVAANFSWQKVAARLERLHPDYEGD